MCVAKIERLKDHSDDTCIWNPNLLKFVSNLLFGFAGARGPAGDHISRMRVGVDICRPLRKRITANILLCLEGHIRCLSSADLQVVVKPLPFVCLILFEVTT